MGAILFFHTSRRRAWIREREGAFRFAKMHGWRLHVVEPSDEPPRVRELLDFWRPLGCIVECSGARPDYFDPGDFAGVPAVFIGRDPRTLPDGASCVNPSPCGAGEKAAAEFVEAGLRAFAFVASPGDYFWSRDREAGFRRTLRRHGMKCAVFGRTSSFGGEPERANALAAFLHALPKPCGVMAENDYAAAFVLDVARREGLAVPSQVSVIGVDDDPLICENTKPKLSSVYLDFEDAGFAACETLARLADDPASGPFRRSYMAMGVVRRGSSAGGVGRSARVAAVLAFVREHACDGITAADAAASVRGSRRAAEIDFLRSTGRTIKDEIDRVRFARVENLLRTPSQELGSVANLCGWRTGNALRAAFRKRYGMSMTAWRSENAGFAKLARFGCVDLTRQGRQRW